MSETKIGPHEQQLRDMREAKAMRASKSVKLKAKGIGAKIVSIKASKRAK